MERYEFNDGKSNKFWEVEVSGSTLTVHYGKIGTQGQTKDKDLASSEAALKEKAKLIKEKTGKGYVAAGSVAAPVGPAQSTAATPAPELVAEKIEATPIPAAVVAVVEGVPVRTSVPDDGARIETGTPLPTRLHPSVIPTQPPEQSWAEVVDQVRIVLLASQQDAQAQIADSIEFSRKEFPQHAKAFRAMQETPLEQAPAEQAAHWYRALEVVMCPGRGWRAAASPAFVALAEHFMRAMVGIRGGQYAIDFLAAMDFKGSRKSGYMQQAWSMLVLIVLRKILSGQPDVEYEAAVTGALELSAREADPVLDTYLAFTLADDRPGQAHALLPRQVLEAAEARGLKPGEQVEYLPLLAEVIAGVPTAWHKYRDYYFYFAYSCLEPCDAAATVCARAREQQASPVPMLTLLLAFASEGERTRLAGFLLDTRELEAFSLLMGMTHDKWIRAALDKGLDVHPRWLFRELLNTYVPRRSDPTVKIRLLQLCQRYDIDLLRGWVADMGTRAEEILAELIDSEVELAEPEQLPRMLQDPPWRRKASKKSEDLVLDLQVIRTPLEIPLDEAGREAYLAQARQQWGRRNSSQLTSAAAVRARCEELEERLGSQKPRRGTIVPPASPLPPAGCQEEELAVWLEARLKGLLSCRDAWMSYYHPYDKIISALLFLPEAFALRIWESSEVLRSTYGTRDGVAMSILFGERAVEGFMGYLGSAPLEALHDAQQVGSSCFAPYVARAFAQLKKARGEALAWLRRYPRAALYGLVPDAVGKVGATRVDAEVALRWMHDNVEGFQTVLEEVQSAYAEQNAGVAEALQQVLTRDPLEQVPAKRPKLPGWFVPPSLTRPRLLTGKCLPDEAMRMVGEMLAFSNPDAPYGGVDVLRQSCTPQSLADFAWDLFSTWLTEGAVGKENWALRALGWFGDDEVARRLTPLIRKWPGESAHARAVTGLDVLADIGSDMALMHLNGIAEKLRFKGLQEKARAKIAAIAEARDLTPEELADRLVPDFDLDARGGLDLNFGPRQFRVGFDEFLKPWVKDASGVRLKALPKPNKSDDTELAAQASARWSSLKKDVRAVASLQLIRLESLLTTGRRITPVVFDTFFARHPLIRNLSQRLVWGVYADATTTQAPQQLFRLTEDLECADVNDDPVDVDFGEKAGSMIGLVHPLQMSETEKAGWGTLFGDYEIAQPFPQLGRDTYALTDEEITQDVITRFEGAKVEAKRIRGMAGRGWCLGEPQDAGCIFWVQRQMRLKDGKEVFALLEFGDGLFAGSAEYEDELQTLEKLVLSDSDWAWSNQANRFAFGLLDAVSASELLRDLTQLADAAKV